MNGQITESDTRYMAHIQPWSTLACRKKILLCQVLNMNKYVAIRRQRRHEHELAMKHALVACRALEAWWRVVVDTARALTFYAHFCVATSIVVKYAIKVRGGCGWGREALRLTVSPVPLLGPPLRRSGLVHVLCLHSIFIICKVNRISFFQLSPHSPLTP